MINILPYNQKKIIERIRALRVVVVTLWAVLFLLMCAIVLLVPRTVLVGSRFTLANEQLTRLESEGIVANPVGVANLEARTRVLVEKLTATLPPSPTERIEVVRSLARSGITLSGFAVEGETSSLEVAGVAANRETLQQFIETLQKQEAVESVESPVSNYVKSVNSPFSITVTFK